MCLTHLSEGISGMAPPVYPVYLSDLNDAEWALLAPLIPAAKPHGRPRSGDSASVAVAYQLCGITDGENTRLRRAGAAYLAAPQR